MASFLYSYETGQWTKVYDDSVAPDTYIVREIPGDEPQTKEIPAERAYDPTILQLLAKFRPPLAEASANTSRPQQSSKKRPHPVEFESDEEDEGPVIVTHNCDEIREKINALIDSKEMKVTEFTKAIRVSGPGYYRFMRQTGTDKGSGCEAYTNAMRFFQKREKLGIPLPKKSKPSVAPSVASGSTIPARPPSVASRDSSSGPANAPTAGANVTVDGEQSDTVPVFDNCDEIRRKIGNYLSKPNITQASFLRSLMSQYKATSKIIQSVQLSRFRGMSGPDAGNTNPVFYAGYVFFEKERIGSGKPKSEARLRMEELYPRGMDVEKGSHRKGFYAMPDGAL